jgi:hypothetical protein
MSANQHKHGAWAEYRRLKRRAILIYVLGILVVVAITSVSGLWLDPSVVGFPLGCAYLVIYFIESVPLARWRCPRCHHPFHLTPPVYWNPYSDSCGHCGLPKWCEPELGSQKARAGELDPTR